METVDYIIVGAGSAGCVLANRLTADPSITVALIEAGGKDNNPMIHMPAGLIQLIPPDTAKENWDYWTEPQSHLNNRKLFWPRGKVLGGSSSINGMVYIRGHGSDYDRWAQLGLPGWGWDDVLPYFKRSEDSARGSDGLHGTGGPLHTEQKPFPSPLNTAFLSAGREAGFLTTDDFNGPQMEGVGTYDTTTKNGSRWSAAKGYLKPVMNRPNLRVITGALTEKITFAANRATGISYRHKGQSILLTAAREVILCGGAINSPQLLMLSGIGPAAHLREKGIEVIADRADVGGNLQDHLDLLLQWTCPQPVSLNRYGRFPDNIIAGIQWAFASRGPGTFAPTVTGAFLKSRPDLVAPDIQLHFIAGYGLPHGVADDARAKQHGYSIHMCQLRPESRGCIKLKSPLPTDHPAINPNYLSAPEDVEVVLKGIEYTRAIGNAPAFAPYRTAETWPGPQVQSREELLAATRAWAETIYHPVGTCRMGPDAGSVVDGELRVRGVERLRVVDASVMPYLVSGNTNAPTIMIAEKASDMIIASTKAEQRSAA